MFPRASTILHGMTGGQCIPQVQLVQHYCTLQNLTGLLLFILLSLPLVLASRDFIRSFAATSISAHVLKLMNPALSWIPL